MLLLILVVGVDQAGYYTAKEIINVKLSTCTINALIQVRPSLTNVIAMQCIFVFKGYHISAAMSVGVTCI